MSLFQYPERIGAMLAILLLLVVALNTIERGRRKKAARNARPQRRSQ